MLRCTLNGTVSIQLSRGARTQGCPGNATSVWQQHQRGPVVCGDEDLLPTLHSPVPRLPVLSASITHLTRAESLARSPAFLFGGRSIPLSPLACGCPGPWLRQQALWTPPWLLSMWPPAQPPLERISVPPPHTCAHTQCIQHIHTHTHTPAHSRIGQLS